MKPQQGLRGICARWKAWREVQRGKDHAIECAVEKFESSYGFAPMAGHVLHIDDREAIVRLMYMTDRIPPERAWFMVAASGGTRELGFAEIAHLEKPWR